MIEYKGYVGKLEFDDEAAIFHGEILGTRDVITFQGESVSELTQAFRDSIDDYLAFCKERGESPDKPFSGQFVTRIDPTRTASPSEYGCERCGQKPQCLRQRATGSGSGEGRCQAEAWRNNESKYKSEAQRQTVGMTLLLWAVLCLRGLRLVMARDLGRILFSEN